MDNKEIKIASKQIYKGRILDVYVDDVKLPNGNTSKRELVKLVQFLLLMITITSFLNTNSDTHMMKRLLKYQLENVI